MKLRQRRKLEKKHRTGEIPTGSFSDIAFLLIIYFILVTSLNKVMALNAELPAGEKQAQSEKSPIIKLGATKMRLNDKVVTTELLEERLAAMDLKSKPKAKRIIMLESDDDTPYELYFTAMSVINKYGGTVAIVEDE